MSTKVDELKTLIDTETQEMLAGIEMDVLTNVTLGDLVRLGSKVTDQAFNTFGSDGEACALSAAAIAAEALGYEL